MKWYVLHYLFLFFLKKYDYSSSMHETTERTLKGLKIHLCGVSKLKIN